MNQSSMKNLSGQRKIPKIDERTTIDIQNRIRELASSYTPQWQFTTKNPDIGSVIGILFSEEMGKNIDRYNQVIDKYHTEFVNMLDISLQPPKPARATVVMDMSIDTIPGIEVNRGTKFSADAPADGEDNQLIFEASHSLYVTSSQISHAFMTNADMRSMIPVKGKFEEQELVPKTRLEEAESALDELVESAVDLLGNGPVTGIDKTFTLFAEQTGIEKNAMLFYHSHMFDIEDDRIQMEILGCDELVKRIGKGEMRLCYYTEDGLEAVEHVEISGDHSIIFQKSKQNKKIEIDGEEYSLLVIEAITPVRESLEVKSIRFSASGKKHLAQFVHNGMTDLNPENFAVFGDTLSLFSECYIGHDAYFSMAGARAHIEFVVSYPVHEVSLTRQQEKDELKIIKKKPKIIWSDTPSDAYAEEIIFEYYNGQGWKKLPLVTENAAMFAECREGKYTLDFLIPGDWKPVSAGAYEGRCIRIQLLKSDNCYMRPCYHHFPVVRDLQISFSYSEEDNLYKQPEIAVVVAGTQKYEITNCIQTGQSFNAFVQNAYSEDALYLCFDKKLENGPISFLVQIDESSRYEGIKCRYEYSTSAGFKQMSVMDYTSDLSRSGMIIFMPPVDMVSMVVEGVRGYWIRIVREENLFKPEKNADAGREKMKRKPLPLIKGILLNAVEVMNIDTQEEREFYLEEVAPNMSFYLGVSDILDADVWVNELGRHNKDEMLDMIEKSPEQVRVEYDVLGDIESFYVKWTEAERLDQHDGGRYYLLDRMNSRILFGDGISSDIPRVIDNVAFKVIVRRCNGEAGNVDAGRINGTMNNLFFVTNIHNPSRAFGASNMESLEKALWRGSNILRARHRLVTAGDYVNEILGFSDGIDKVSCIVGYKRNGDRDEHVVSMVVLLKDYQVGEYTFRSLAAAIKKHLLATCELSVEAKDLYITEPIFVEISVDIWADIMSIDDNFEIQNALQKVLEDYLTPVDRDSGDGWEIGTLPKKSQILMKLNVLKNKAVIRKMVIIAKYSDASGVHEMALEDVDLNPFMICRSGQHRVHVMNLER